MSGSMAIHSLVQSRKFTRIFVRDAISTANGLRLYWFIFSACTITYRVVALTCRWSALRFSYFSFRCRTTWKCAGSGFPFESLAGSNETFLILLQSTGVQFAEVSCPNGGCFVRSIHDSSHAARCLSSTISQPITSAFLSNSIIKFRSCQIREAPPLGPAGVAARPAMTQVESENRAQKSRGFLNPVSIHPSLSSTSDR